MARMRRISIKMPKELMEELGRTANELNYSGRGEFIRFSVRSTLNEIKFRKKRPLF